MRPTASRRLPLVAEQSGWREYFYPETLEHADGVVQGTLRNLLGERDDERLAAAEYPLARYRAHQLRLDPALVPHTLDEEVGAVSKPRGRSRRGKGTARKVSEILNSIARLVRAVSVLVDALGRWLS